MGWTHATIDGLTIHELVCEVQADLIRGVNERRECIGLSPLYFYYGDGTVTKTYPSAADFDGFPLLGEDVAISAPLLSNLTAVQNFLTGTAPNYFVTTSTGNTKYTAETLAAAVGLGAFPSLASGWNFRDSTLWQRMQDALDLLTVFTIRTTETSSYGYLGISGAGFVSREDAWDAAVANVAYEYGGNSLYTGYYVSWDAYTGWSFSKNTSLNTYSSGVGDSRTYAYDLTSYTGDIVHEEYEVGRTYRNVAQTCTFDVEGTTYTNPTHESYGVGVVLSYQLSTKDSVLPGVLTVDVSKTTSNPASNPFSGYGTDGYSTLGITGLNINADISAYITDQA